MTRSWEDVRGGTEECVRRHRGLSEWRTITDPHLYIHIIWMCETVLELFIRERAHEHEANPTFVY